MRDKRVESMQIDLDELISLRQQLAECQARERVRINALQISELYVPAGHEHAQVAKAIAQPSDSTALDSAIRQAKLESGREALLEASKYAAEQSQESKKAWGEYAKGCSAEAASIAIRLNQMAEEMQ